MSKLVRIETDHSYELKILFEVLKEVFNDVNIDFMRSDTQTAEPQKKKPIKNTTDEPSETVKKTKKKEEEKKPVKKTQKKQAQKDSEEDELDEEDEDEVSVKKNAKKQQTSKANPVAKKKVEENDEEEDDEEETQKETKKKSTIGGIRIMALDNNQLRLIYVKLNPDQFLDFYVKPDCLTIGLDLIEFHKFVKTIDKDSIMTIQIDKDDDQNIAFGLKNGEKGISSKYKQKLMDINDESNQLPLESNFHMSVMMETSDFKKICTELSQFSEYVEITCTNKEITFRCRGDSNTYEKSFENSKKGVKIISLKKDGPPIFQAIYNLSHLVTFGRCTNLCTEMQLYLRNDYPLFIYFTIGDLGKLLVGLSTVDGKIVKKDNDYNADHDKFYKEKNIVLKN